MSYQLELNIPEIIARMYQLDNQEELDRFKAVIENFILSSAIDKALEKKQQELAFKVDSKGLLLEDILNESSM